MLSSLFHVVALTTQKAFADDIGLLANEEKCDVIVDDIYYVSS